MLPGRLAALAGGAILCLMVPLGLTVAAPTALAGGIECPDGQGTYNIGYAAMDGTVSGDFNAFSYQLDGRQVTLAEHKPYRLVTAFAGTDESGWGFDFRRLAGGSLRYDSSQPFDDLIFCISPVSPKDGTHMIVDINTNINSPSVVQNTNTGRVTSESYAAVPGPSTWRLNWSWLWGVTRNVAIVVGIILQLFPRRRRA